MFHNKSLVEETTRLRKFSMRLTKNKANSDDLLQSTLLRAIENKHRFMDGTNLFHWTSRIMFNIFVSDYRRQKNMDLNMTQNPSSIIYKLLQIKKTAPIFRLSFWPLWQYSTI